MPVVTDLAGASAPRADLVSCERGEALLVVPVREGAAELARACALRGSARRLFERGGLDASAEEVAGWLVEEGAEAEQAARDAAAFREGWRRRFAADARPVAGGPEGPGGPEAPPFAVGPEDLEALARAVLAGGHRLRFQARGRSMRPFLPHGSTLDVGAADFDTVGRGEVVLYVGGEHRLVAHRVVGREDGVLVTRGDSSARLDRVTAADFLGTVAAARRPGAPEAVPVSAGFRRVAGLVCGQLHAWATAAARVLVIGPLRRSYGRPSWLRAALRAPLRLAGFLLFGTERLAARLRRPLDELHAALFSTEEKDEERRRLYQDARVQDFTARDENIAAGLTLIEEVLLARHGIEPCRALVVGCGPGRECFALAERGFDVTGVDREPAMLAEGRRLAAERELDVRFEEGEATGYRLAGEPFELVVVFSGLYNMVLPRARREELLRRALEHLRPGGLLAVTFVSAYVAPGLPPRPRVKTFLEALSPDHEDGDRYLLNETEHVFPRGADVAAEARAAGAEVVALFRDQRTYDRRESRVKGYALLRRN